MRQRAAIAALLAAAYAGGVWAQATEAPPAVPAEFSEAARNSYAVALKEARTLATQKEYDLALNRLEALAAERPREPQARFLKATILTEQGKDAEAMVQLVTLTSDFPELPEPHNNLAVLYGRKGQYELARHELEIAVAASPDYAIGHENLGDVYTRLAAIQYERVAALDKRGKTGPLKLKLVRDALAVNEPPVTVPAANAAKASTAPVNAVSPTATTSAATPATATSTAAPAASPSATAPAGSAAPTPPEPLVIKTETPAAVPAMPDATDTKEITK